MSDTSEKVLARAESAIKATTSLAIADALIDFALERIDDAIHDYGGVEGVKSELLALYDRLIAPVDVPYIPEAVESMLDMMAKQAIAQAIDKGHAAIHQTKTE